MTNGGDPRVDGLVGRLDAQDGLIAALMNDVAALRNDLAAAAIPIDEKRKLIYQHASDWLRMVNTTVWTLNSIFLVGSILALNVASQSPSPHWKHTAGWMVLILCVIWFIADATYTASGWRARYLLSSFENDFVPNRRLYSWPLDRDTWWKKLYWLLWIIFQIATYVPIAGIAYLACTEFIRA